MSTLEDEPQLPRVAVFIDAQNMYKGARDAFFDPKNDHFTCGQFLPVDMAEQIVGNGRKLQKQTLEDVRIYTGRPSSSKESKAYGAHRSQCAAWEKAGATVIHRQLRYPSNWPTEPAEEKGIDVALAIDFVVLAVEDKFDVGVIASCDTDLRPALEFVHRKFSKSTTPKHVEVASWRSDKPGHRSRLTFEGSTEPFCHWFDRNTYEKLRDRMNYVARVRHIDGP